MPDSQPAWLYFVPFAAKFGISFALLTWANEIVIGNKTGVCEMLDQEVDDRGTDQEEAQHMLEALREQGFDGDNEKLATALGRSIEQVEAMTSGAETIDDDIVMKARGIALHRGLEIE
jgi:hypothetical protein